MDSRYENELDVVRQDWQLWRCRGVGEEEWGTITQVAEIISASSAAPSLVTLAVMNFPVRMTRWGLILVSSTGDVFVPQATVRRFIYIYAVQ